MIDLTVHEDRRANAVARAKERGITVPTFAQMVDPSTLGTSTVQSLSGVGLWDVDPKNLFRITWKNEPVESGGGFGGVNHLVLPSSLTGIDATIVCLVGRYFPTGAHKVGAAFGCLAPRLVTGQFDPTTQKAVWPSTGNYCRGGAYDSALLGTDSIAILPEGMSAERFEWLEKIAGEVIKTPGSESNVKEIFDKCWELKESGQDLMIFNQFEEEGNYLWHYTVTGSAFVEVLEALEADGKHYAGSVFTTGSAGTIASGDRLKQRWPTSFLGASEALQCPTLLENGFGAHRIEGIGDKHVPWVHNVRNTDAVTAIDDNAVVAIARLFNEPAGQAVLKKAGVPDETVAALNLMGFSGIANILSAIKLAKYYELSGDQVVATVLTDSMDLYQSRLKELHDEHGAYTETDAAADLARYLHGERTDAMAELTYESRRRIHNLKYYTWIEQQGRELEELNAQWYEPDHWTNIQAQVGEIDALIEQFNQDVAG